MKRKKLWAAVFGLLGLALAGIALWLCFTSLDAPARVLGVDDRAAERTESWMDAVCAGDYAAAGAMMYGAPELSVGADPEDPAGVFFWETFVDSLSYQFHGDDKGCGREGYSGKGTGGIRTWRNCTLLHSLWKCHVQSWFCYSTIY